MKPKGQSVAGPFVKNESVKNLFRQKSLVERLEPVLHELLLYIQGESASQRGLPEYCYNIFKALRKAQFGVLPDSVRFAANNPKAMDWKAFGVTVGAGLRCFRFGELEMDGVLKQSGLASTEITELLQILGGIPGFEKLSGPLGLPGNRGKNTFMKGAEELWAAYLNTSQAAYQSGSESLAQLSSAFQKGLEGFLDDEGRCRVENARDNIYWFLLIIWPEIQEMQQRVPPVTRKDFAGWLEPFADAGLVSIGDLDQLLDVCDDIGLKFKGRGAPRKK